MGCGIFLNKVSILPFNKEHPTQSMQDRRKPSESGAAIQPDGGGPSAGHRKTIYFCTASDNTRQPGLAGPFPLWKETTTDKSSRAYLERKHVLVCLSTRIWVVSIGRAA